MVEFTAIILYLTLQGQVHTQLLKGPNGPETIEACREHQKQFDKRMEAFPVNLFKQSGILSIKYKTFCSPPVIDETGA